MICTKCKKEKTPEEMAWKSKVKGKRSAICHVCNNERSRRYFKANPHTRKDSEKKAKQRIRDFLNDAKSVPCMDCGKSYPPFVMDFDHVRGEKKCDIARMSSRSMTAINKEIAKCDVVCANCHRIRHIDNAGL